MGLAHDVGGLFAEEWARLLAGLRGLTGDEYRALQLARDRARRREDDPATVSIPGWDDVIKIGPRQRPTNGEVEEWYRARREHREPQISAEARASIERYRERVQNIRTSAQPEYSQAWGQVLTALDNVQDFVSTLATAGRLTLWSGAALLGGLNLVSPAAAGAVGGAAAKVGGRFVPVLGWVILLGDLLNLLGLAGMLANPLYTMLCAGPRNAAAAGFPTALFKRGLKSEVWNAARRNPFGREARLNARSRAIPKLPSIGNLLEVGQTTEQLWGYGISFGGIVGALTEAGAVLTGATGDKRVQIRGGWGLSELMDRVARGGRDLSPAEKEILGDAARVVQHAPSVFATQDVFTTEEHLTALVAYLAALPIVASAAGPLWTDDRADQLMDAELIVRPHVRPETRRLLELEGLDLEDGARWPVAGAPRVIRAADLVEAWAPATARATRDFIARRRDTAEGCFAACAIAQGTEVAWYQLTGQEDALRFQLAPDYALLAGLAEDGYVLNATEDPDALWRFWSRATAAVRRNGGRYPGLVVIDRLAAAQGLTLMKLLPPDAAWPAEWLDAFPEQADVEAGTPDQVVAQVEAELPRAAPPPSDPTRPGISDPGPGGPVDPAHFRRFARPPGY